MADIKGIGDGGKGVFDGCIIFCDLDGTLVDDEKNIPQNNIEAIKYFEDNGGFFTIASGRCAQSIRDYAVKVGVNCPVVTLNGCSTYDYDKEEVVFSKKLPDNFLAFIKDVNQKFPEVGIQCYVGSEVFNPYPNDVTDELLVIENLVETRCDFDELPKIINKILIGGTPDVLKKVFEYHKQNPTDGFYGMMTAPVYYELIPDNSNKGAAAMELSAKLGIEKDKVFAIGDFYNDIDLFKAVGYPIVTDNAPDDVKVYGKYITCHCREGAVSDAVMHIEQLLCAKT